MLKFFNLNLDNYLPLVGGEMTGRIDIMITPALAAIRQLVSILVKADGASDLVVIIVLCAHKDYVRVYATPVWC